MHLLWLYTVHHLLRMGCLAMDGGSPVLREIENSVWEPAPKNSGAVKAITTTYQTSRYESTQISTSQLSAITPTIPSTRFLSYPTSAITSSSSSERPANDSPREDSEPQYSEKFIVPLCRDNRTNARYLEYMECVSYNSVMAVHCSQMNRTRGACMPIMESAIYLDKNENFRLETQFSKQQYRYFNIFVACCTKVLTRFDLRMDEFSIIIHEVVPHYIIHFKPAIDLCLPLFQNYGQCSNRSGIEQCTDNTINVTFVGCQLSSLQRNFFEAFLVQAVYTDSLKAIGDLCDDKAREKIGKSFGSFLVPLCADNKTYNTYNDHKTCVSFDSAAGVACHLGHFSHQWCMPFMLDGSYLNNHVIMIYDEMLLTLTYRYYNFFLACGLHSLHTFDMGFSDFSAKYIHNGVSHYVIHNNTVIDACLPLFQYYGHCKNLNQMTHCTDGNINVTLVNCKLPMANREYFEQFLTQMIHVGNTLGIRALCEGHIEVEEEKYFEIFLIPNCTSNSRYIIGSSYKSCDESNSPTLVTCSSENLNQYRCLQYTYNYTSKDHDIIVNDEAELMKIPFRYLKFLTACTKNLALHHNIDADELKFGQNNDEVKYIVTVHKMVKEVCAPLFQYYGQCIYGSNFTSCTDGNVTVLFTECNLPAVKTVHFQVWLLEALMNDDIYVFDVLCKGETDMVTRRIGNVSALLIAYQDQAPAYILNDFTTSNYYWPCCYNKYAVIWDHIPEA
ncbi:hypothetical protein SK128_020187, partial [Halocaridina rubra]